jgi:hypothetical protein
MLLAALLLAASGCSRGSSTASSAATTPAPAPLDVSTSPSNAGAPARADAARERDAELTHDGRCYTITVAHNSAGTNALCERRQLQCGGPTWAGVVGVLLRRHAAVLGQARGYAADMPGFGVPYEVTFERARTWVIIDDESDDVIMCSGSRALLQVLRAEYERLNQDAAALSATLDQVPADEAE